MAACGGAPPPVDATAPTGPVTRTVTAAGATLRVVGDDRGVLELTFPPDGVFEDLEVTVSPLAAAAGGRARFDVVPAGVLLQKPVEMLFTAPAGVELTAQSTFTLGPADDVVMLPSAREGPASLRTGTWFLGAAAQAIGASSAHGGAGVSVDIADINCQIALSDLLQRFYQAESFPFSSAESGTQLIAQIEATKLLCADDIEGGFDALRPILQEKSCEGYRDASVNATFLEVDDAKALKDIAGRILNWEAAKQATGTDCGQPVSQIQIDLVPVFDKFIDGYEGRVGAGDLPTNYDELWLEVRQVIGVKAHADVFGFESTSDKVRDALLGKMFDLLRNAAYDHCRSDGEQAYLVDLLMGGSLYRRPLTPLALTPAVAPNLPPWADYTVDALLDDIQYCASKVVIEVFTPLARLVAEHTRTLEGSATPGTHVTKASTRAPATGSIGLDGAIGAFQCRSPDRSSEDVLVVRLNGTEVDRITRSGRMLLGSQRKLDVGEMLAKAGLDPTLKRTYPLVLEREGESCQTLYGISPTKLFTFDLEVDPEPILSSAAASIATLPASETVSVTFSLDFEDASANVDRLRFEASLQGVVFASVEEPATGTSKVGGFDQVAGVGTFTDTVRIGCSEVGRNPLALSFRVVDAFDQESSVRSASITVDYAGCF